MKKAVALLCALALIFGLVGCGSDPAPKIEFDCLGQNRTCPNKQDDALDLFCDSCDPDGDNIEGIKTVSASAETTSALPATESSFEEEKSVDEDVEPEEPAAEVLIEEPVVEETPPETAPPVEDNGRDYVLNTNTKKFHYPSCSSVSDIKPSNRKDFHGTRDEVINKGYKSCGRCHP